MEEGILKIRVLVEETKRNILDLANTIDALGKEGQETGEMLRKAFTIPDTIQATTDALNKLINVERTQVKTLQELEALRIQQNRDIEETRKYYDKKIKSERESIAATKESIRTTKGDQVAKENLQGKLKDLKASLHDLTVARRENLTALKGAHAVERRMAAESLADVKKQAAETKRLAAQNITTLKQQQVEARKTASGFQSIGKSIATSLRGMMVRFISFYAVIGTIRNIITTIAEFEQGMKELQAITNATEEDMLRLEKQAINLAGAYRFNAKSITELYLQYAKLGFTIDEIEKATEATLQLSTATGEDLASSAQIAASVIRGLQKDASELQQIVDVMGVGFNTSALDLSRFRESIKYILPIAKELGISFEMLTALLGKLADAQIYGSLAGTSLRNLFAELADESSLLSKTIGFQVKSDEDLLNAIDKLNKMGLELGDIFQLVEKRATTTLAVIIDNADGMRDYKAEIDAAGGEMQRMADKVMESLQSQIKATKNEWQAFILSLDSGRGAFGEISKGVVNWGKDIATVMRILRDPTVMTQQMVDRFTDLNKTLQTGEGRFGVLIERYKSLSVEAQTNYLANEELRYVIDEIVKLMPEAAEGFDAYGRAIGVSIPKVEAATAANKEYLKSIADISIDKLTKDIFNAITTIGYLDRAQSELNDNIFEYNKKLKSVNSTRELSRITRQITNMRQSIVESGADIEYQRAQLQGYVLQLRQLGMEWDEIRKLFSDETQWDFWKRVRFADTPTDVAQAQEDIQSILPANINIIIGLQVDETRRQQVIKEFNELRKNLQEADMTEDEAYAEAFRRRGIYYSNQVNRWTSEVERLQEEYIKAREDLSTDDKKKDAETLRRKIALFLDYKRIAQMSFEELNKYASESAEDANLQSEENARKELSRLKRVVEVKYQILESENRLLQDSLKKRENAIRLSYQKEIELLTLERDKTPGLSDEEKGEFTKLIAQKYKEMRMAMLDVDTNYYAERADITRQNTLLELQMQVKTLETEKENLRINYEAELEDLENQKKLRLISEESYNDKLKAINLKYARDERNLEIDQNARMRELEFQYDQIMLKRQADSLDKRLEQLEISYEKQLALELDSLEKGVQTYDEFLKKKYNLFIENEYNIYEAKKDWLDKQYNLDKSYRDRELGIQQDLIDASGLEGEDAQKAKVRAEIDKSQQDLKAAQDRLAQLQARQAWFQETGEGIAVDPEEMKDAELSVREYEAALGSLQQQLNELNKINNIWEMLGIPSKYWEGLNMLYDETTQVLQDIFDKNVEYADRQVEIYDQLIDEKQRQIDQEIQYELEGYANKKSIREAELADLIANRKKAQEEQQKALQQQERMEKFIQYVNMVTAVSEVIKAAAKGGALIAQPWLIPVIAAGVSAAIFGIMATFTSKAKSLKYAEGGSYLIEGRRHSEGGEIIREGESGERVSIFSREATQKYDKTIQGFTDAINSGRLSDFFLPQKELRTIALDREVGDRLDFKLLRPNVEKVQEMRKVTEQVNRVDLRVGLDDSKQLQSINNILKANLRKQKEVTETKEFRIERFGNMTRRIRKC